MYAFKNSIRAWYIAQRQIGIYHGQADLFPDSIMDKNSLDLRTKHQAMFMSGEEDLLSPALHIHPNRTYQLADFPIQF